MDVPMNLDGYNDHENDEEDNMQDNYTDDYLDKRKAVSFIMNLKDMYRIREVYMLIFVMLYIVVHSYYLFTVHVLYIHVYLSIYLSLDTTRPQF